MNIAMIGTGYVGTVTGACFAATGNSVVCVDRDAEKVRALSGGDPVIYEPGLDDLIRGGLEAGNLEFTTSMEEAVSRSEVIFLTVGTPALENGEADLSCLREAAESIALEMNDYRIIVTKSTVPVGTHRRVAQWMRRHTSESFDVVSNPEFLREGCAVEDFMRPERIVIGSESPRAFETMKELYRPFADASGGRIIRMDPVSSELTKYACNAFLATRISFMNELAQLCDRTGGDIECLREGMGLDSRIGPKFLEAGIGYGGSCFPKDIRALIQSAYRNGVRLNIANAVEEANRLQKEYLFRQIERRFGDDLSGMTFALWGLAFKAGTDDVREAPALVLASKLISAGARVKAFDPVAAENARRAIGEGIELSSDPYSCLDAANALVVATEWREFMTVDFDEMRKRMKEHYVFDGRNIFAPRALMEAGFIYQGVGRGHESVSSLPVRLFCDQGASKRAMSA